MSLRRVDNFIDGYPARAEARAPHEMSGRGAERGLTELVNERITERLGVTCGDVVVDVGCGDGSLLAALSPTITRGIGVVPTEAEAGRLRRHHRARSNLEKRAS